MAADAQPDCDVAPRAAEPANDAEPAANKSKGKGKAKDGSKKRKASDVDDAAAFAGTRAALGAHSEANGTAHGANEAEDGEGVDEDDDERPLSRKERRQAKKRKLAAYAAGDGEAATPTKPAKSTTSASSSQPAATTSIGSTLVGNTPSRSAHGVWVGNLNFATHPRELLQWFKERGLEEVTRINMPGGKRHHENNRGFAYLDFPSATDVTIAVGLSEQHLDGRKLLIKASTDYAGRPAPSASTSTSAAAPGAGAGTVKEVLSTLDSSALERPQPSAAVPAGEAPATLNRTARKILSRQKNPAGPTLFLGNLGFETTVEDIRDMFDRNQRRGREWAKGGIDEEEEEEEDVEEEEEEAGKVKEAEEEEKKDEDDAPIKREDGEEKKPKADKKRDQKKKREKGAPLDLAKAKDAGIRKVRLGTFEDSGKCKGWAFVDFHLPAQATRALLNLHNHQLNGRKLNVEYASAEAVRRGAVGTKSGGGGGGGRGNAGPKRRGPREEHEEGGEEEYEQRGAGRGQRREREWDDTDVKALAAQAGADTGYDGPPSRAHRGPKPQRDDARKRGREDGGGVKRPKPGAALAMAQRASEGIVQSTGKKITFD
ncbi:RNP24 [Rhodotorula toruloides]|uniref:RNP24 n=1 Tax=Rhodotorula toruloides TaxID=5286 RepID=A0A511KD37_RHOTO|nr:RNP24 [Rhodotorula toruloides]